VPDRASLRAACTLVALLGALAVAADEAPLALARVSLVERGVELEKRGARWQAVVEGGPLALGEALRTGPDAVARLELSWMALTLGPGSLLRFPDAFLLKAVLESGRASIDSEARDALTLVTAEAEVRGRGRAVVRRQGRTTLVTCLSGRYFVSAARSTVVLSPGEATLASAGGAAPPTRAPLPPATASLWPGRDAVYAAPGEPIELRWQGEAAGYHVELLPVGSEVLLVQRDVTAPPLRLEVPWEGAFRWRVSSRDARGIEGPPSGEGLIAVDAR
jgi:hypothetical protein